VRSLLDLNEQLLNEYYFTDSYWNQKQFENEYALNSLPDYLHLLDSMTWKERQVAFPVGLLAGNVFDWGAKEVVNLLESREGVSFAKAKDLLQPRPWTVDDLDPWLERLRQPDPHECACIFADNSGADIVLGIVPFARELLQRGTKVILCANSRPALNDVTFNELELLAERISTICPLIKESLINGSLKIAENGQGSPCLDLSRLDGGLAGMIKSMNVDLIILEGMGRAIHTNYTTTFTCESLKVAVLKNQWLAKRFGGEMFSVVFRYERPKKVTFDTVLSENTLLYP